MRREFFYSNVTHSTSEFSGPNKALSYYQVILYRSTVKNNQLFTYSPLTTISHCVFSSIGLHTLVECIIIRLEG